MKAVVQNAYGSGEVLELKEIDRPAVGESGVLVVVDRTYPLRETPAAVEYVGRGHARGKVVITVESCSSRAPSGRAD